MLIKFQNVFCEKHNDEPKNVEIHLSASVKRTERRSLGGNKEVHTSYDVFDSRATMDSFTVKY
mgnify:CR=1 FL=1